MNFVGICFCFIFLQNLILKIHAECSIDIASSGTITSPDYPENYDNNLDRTYTIRSPSGRTITLVFLVFEVGNNYCHNDYLQIQDGDDVDSRKVVCGYSLPGPFIAMSGILVVKLHTNYFWTHKGFEAYFNDSRGCSIDMVDMTSGTLTSPNYPEDYENNLDYTFTLSSRAGRPITFLFLDFQVGFRYDYCDDYVQLQDGSYDKTVICGNTLPDPFVALSGKLIVQFHTNNDSTNNGFKALFNDSLDCSRHLIVSQGVIQTPNYPNMYDDNTYCMYQLSNAHGYSINLTFKDFQLENSTNCEYDYVEIRTHDENPEKLCGYPDVPFYRTISNGSKVVFYSDYSRTDKGFYAVFNEIREHTSEQYSTSLAATSLATETLSTEFETSSVTAAEITTTISEALSTSETNTPLLLKGQEEGHSSVPIIIGTVIGFVVLTIITIILILWYLRRKTASKKPLQTAFSNENYNIHYTNGPETETSKYSNEDTGYSNVENGRCKINNIDQNYDFATAIPRVQKDSTNEDNEEQEGEYIDQEDSYNILNVHPKKSGTTEIYDRTTEGVYDSAKSENDDMDIGLYDHTPTSPDHEYDSTVIIKRNVDDVYN